MFNYDPNQISVVFNGILLSGFSDGDFVTVELEADMFTKTVGAGGDVVRVRSANRSGMCTVTLQAESPINDLLSQHAKADYAGVNTTGALLLRNNNGTTIASAPNAWIKKLPTVAFGADAGSREWVFEFDTIDMFVGGAIT